MSPGFTENGLSELESKFAPALKRVIRLSIPTTSYFCAPKEDVEAVSSFAVNLMVRNPEILFTLRDDICRNVNPESLAPYRDILETIGLNVSFEGVVQESVTRSLLLDAFATSLQGAMIADLKKLEGMIIRAPRDACFSVFSFPVLPVLRGDDDATHLVSLYFPLCSEAAIIFGRGSCSGIRRSAQVDASVVGKLNAALFALELRKTFDRERSRYS